MKSRTDSNQSIIAKTLRRAGATVQTLHEVGNGVPDLLVGYKGKNFLLEVKTDKGQLNEKQVEFFHNWKGNCYVVRTEHAALQSIGAVR